MKLNVFTGDVEEERIDIFVREENRIVQDIKNLLSDRDSLVCFRDGEVYKLRFSDIVLFCVEKDKIRVHTHKESYFLRERLYEICEKMPSYFIKLNQSSIGNVREIKKFDCSASGTLKVTFKNGLTDYVSRRQIKSVKERLGL